jgi:hypothetical protein
MSTGIVYFIQFVAGTQGLVHESLARTVQGFDVVYEDESSAMFESRTRISSSAQLPFANNVFIVLARTSRRGVDRSVRQLTTLVSRTLFPPIKGAHVGFRVMFQIDGSLASIDRQLRAALEREISIRTRSRVEARGSCQEYWVVGRKDLGELLLCARLPKAKRPDRAKGSLSYELSEMLVAASQPQARETFLDPFAGSGALVQARLGSPAKSIIYSDVALAEFRSTLPREVKSDRRVRLLDEDATRLSSIGDGQIDVIVTDPPWGEFEKLDIQYSAFAERVATSFDRVLNHRTGRFVILTSRRNAASFTDALTNSGFQIRSTPGILVNGHPATVLIGGRQP